MLFLCSGSRVYFFSPMSVTWPSDWLWPIECSRSDIFLGPVLRRTGSPSSLLGVSWHVRSPATLTDHGAVQKPKPAMWQDSHHGGESHKAGHVSENLLNYPAQPSWWPHIMEHNRGKMSCPAKSFLNFWPIELLEMISHCFDPLSYGAVLWTVIYSENSHAF